MEESVQSLQDFKLDIPHRVVESVPGDDVTLGCHLSPATSAVAMEIRWFKDTDCIYMYANGECTEGRGYEDRVSVNPQRLQRGDVSLTLRGFGEEDEGVYTCQVISGEHKQEGRIRLAQSEQRVDKQITAEERKIMEKSVQSLDFKLIIPYVSVTSDLGDNVTLACHLFPATSAVAMEIRWFKGTDCIYLYVNGHVTVIGGYEGRVSVNTQQLERGDVSLTLDDVTVGDLGVYTCQVMRGQHKQEGRIKLDYYGSLVDEEITAAERKRMEESVQPLDCKLIIRYKVLWSVPGDDVTLGCHLAPATSAVAMEIRWLKGTDCIYRNETDSLYMNVYDDETVRGGYEDRVSVTPQQLERGDVSLTLRGVTEEDAGVYTCQIIRGEYTQEGRIKLELTDFKLIIPHRVVESDPGDDVTLACHFSPATSAVAMEIRWFKDTDCIYLYRKGHVTVGGGYEDRVSVTPQQLQRGDVSLTLRGFREEDEGVYTCQVISGEHTQEGRVRLDAMDVYADYLVYEDYYERYAFDEKLGHYTYFVKEVTAEERKRMEKSVQPLVQLEKMTSELQEKDSQLQELRTQLLQKERELEERERKMEERDRQQEMKKGFGDYADPPLRRRRSRKDPPQMGGESPGPAPPVSPAVSELRLVLLGGSAAGKRAAGNTILGTEEFGRQASTHTLTHTSTESQHSESRQGEVAGRRLTVVETPDWFCSGLSEKDMRRDVGLCVCLSAPGPHAFVLLIPVEPSEGEERRMLEKMEDIFGEGCWRHTLILFTHAEGLGQRSVEELLQTGSQELQQLVEKCGNRCHLLNIKDRPDDTKITQLLEKIEEMVSGNRETFYSSETYQEAERQAREIERRMQSERQIEERKLREEKERREELDTNVYSQKMEGEIQQHEGEIKILNVRTTELERKMKEERDEKKRRKMEKELCRETVLREEMERKLNRVREKRERERREMKERHREEMEEMREIYEREVRAEAERSLMKIILHELQRNISMTKEIQGFNREVQSNIGITKEKVEVDFKKQLEQKDREIRNLRQDLKQKESVKAKVRLTESTGKQRMEAEMAMQHQREKDRELERLQQTLAEKDREIARLRLKQGSQ